VVNAASIVGRGWASPAPMPQRELWDGFFAEHYGNDRLAKRIWERAGVRTRHGVADPRTDDVSAWGTEQRMRRFVTEGLSLGKEAVANSLEDAGVTPDRIGQFTVASCTGYATPGLDILLARDLGMPVSTQRLHVGHMGCYAAIPGLAAVAASTLMRDELSVLLCVELTSLHVQPRDDSGGRLDVEQVVAHALFSDAAAAVVVAPDAPGLELVDVVARTDVARSPLMTWDVTDLGFRMGLSPEVPTVLAEHVQDAVTALLAPQGLSNDDVARWAIHPGGPRIVEVVAERLGLDDEAVATSRKVLADHGNCSSATVLLILDRILDEGLEPGDPVVVMAFGPGLTLYAALLRVRE
jgi:predicted naringenin-chalcone synthase